MKRNQKILLGIIIAIAVFFIGRFLLVTSQFFPVLLQVVFNKEIKLKQADTNVNLLLLGVGGKDHDGPYLTDTIIFLSIDPVNSKLSLISIPRDLWVPDLKAKINSAYSTGESKKQGGGLILSKAVAQKILNQPIDYALRIDFEGFVKAVDLVGGLEINVERTFRDEEYPIDGKEMDPCGHTEEELIELATASAQLEAFPCRYKTISFQQGLKKMDGKTALEYVRSRHADGPEGTDFARSKRQEKIISAFKDKVISLDMFINPGKIISLYDVLRNSIDTDIKEDEFDDFIKLSQKIKNGKIQSGVIDIGSEKDKRQGLLINPLEVEEFGGQWVLIPKEGSGNFTEIQNYINCFLKEEKCNKLIKAN